MKESILATILLLVAGAFLIVFGSIKNSSTEISIGTVLMILASLPSFTTGKLCGEGKIGWAKNKLSPGERYDCITEIAENDGVYFSIVKTCNDEIYGLRFETLPPVKGVVSKTGDEITFLSINPKELPTPEAETADTK